MQSSPRPPFRGGISGEEGGASEGYIRRRPAGPQLVPSRPRVPSLLLSVWTAAAAAAVAAGEGRPRRTGRGRTGGDWLGRGRGANPRGLGVPFPWPARERRGGGPGRQARWRPSGSPKGRTRGPDAQDEVGGRCRRFARAPAGANTYDLFLFGGLRAIGASDGRAVGAGGGGRVWLSREVGRVLSFGFFYPLLKTEVRWRRGEGGARGGRWRFPPGLRPPPPSPPPRDVAVSMGS